MLNLRYWQFKVLCLLVLAALVATSTSALLAIHAQGTTKGDWPTYLENNPRIGFNGAETTITATTASNLHVHWTYTTGGVISTQPVVANGRVYWGSWDGKEYATDLAGKKLWSTSIGGQTPDCKPPAIFGVTSTATIADVLLNGTDTPVVFVGGRDTSLNVASLFALQATTGAVIWETPLSSAHASFSWSSPAVYNGSIYMGVASVDDCPLARGALVQLDATTGAIQHTFYTVPKGCLGGGIWSSPTIDEAAGMIYVTTGNHGFGGSCVTTEIYSSALVELRASDLSFVDSWQVPPSEQVIDSDFGATPTLFTATIAGSVHELVGALNKNGTFYAFDRSSLHAGPVWRAKISTGRENIAPAAWDGATLYVASRVTSIGGTSCPSSLRALNPATGGFIWERCLTNGRVFAAVSAVPGVAFVGESSHVVAIATATGKILFNYNMHSTIYGAASISNGVVYLGNSAGTLYAFGL